MLDQDKKCICKKCKDCRLYLQWDYTGPNGVRTQLHKCVFEVISRELPNLRADMNGMQESVEDGRNRAHETKEAVGNFMESTRKTLAVVSKMKLIGDK